MRVIPIFMLVLCCATSVFGSVIIAGFPFENNAFADHLVASNGSFTLGGAGTLEDQLVGSNVNDYAFCYGGPSVCNVTLSFVDNVAVNGTDEDLVVMELGSPDPFQLTFNGITNQYDTFSTGFSNGSFAINAAVIDLSDFGIAAGGTVSQFTVGSIDNGTTISYTLFAALNSRSVGSVPEPSAILLSVSGLAFVAFRKWHRRVG